MIFMYPTCTSTVPQNQKTHAADNVEDLILLLTYTCWSHSWISATSNRVQRALLSHSQATSGIASPVTHPIFCKVYHESSGNWITEMSAVVCRQEEGWLQQGDIVSNDNGECFTVSCCFEYKGDWYALATGFLFKYTFMKELFMFVPQQNQIVKIGVRVSESLHSSLFRINTTLVSVKPTTSVILPTGNNSMNGKPLSFGTLFHGVSTRSKRSLTGIVTAPVFSPENTYHIGLRSVDFNSDDED